MSKHTVLCDTARGRIEFEFESFEDAMTMVVTDEIHSWSYVLDVHQARKLRHALNTAIDHMHGLQMPGFRGITAEKPAPPEPKIPFALRKNAVDEHREFIMLQAEAFSGERS